MYEYVYIDRYRDINMYIQIEREGEKERNE